jgi:hypothetical protein
VASFCNKCGNPLPSSSGFCPSCGAPILPAPDPALTTVPSSAYTPVAVPTPVQPYSPPPGSPQPMPGRPAPYPGTPAPNPGGGGSGALKIILIIVACIIGLFLLVGGLIGYKAYKFAQAVKHSVQTDSNGQTTFSTPNGSFTTGKNVTATAAELGAPIYPGATPGHAGVRMKNKEQDLITVVYTTSDDLDTVVAFYKSKMPDAVVTTNSFSHATVLKSGQKNDQTMVTISPSNGIGNTSIMIMRVHTPQS